MNDREEFLIKDLLVPVKAFRIFALEEVIRVGNSPQMLASLQELALQEDDQECLLLLRHAVEAVQKRLSENLDTTQRPSLLDGKVPEQSPGSDAFAGLHPSDLLKKWESADVQEKMCLLTHFSRKLAPRFRELGPDLLFREESPILISRVIRIFSSAWPPEKTYLLTQLVDSPHLSIKLASLRTLVHINPGSLLEKLPEHLNHSDPQVKAFAIRALSRIDPEETSKHLEGLLFSKDLAGKTAGLVNCTFLPIEMVKPILLRFLSAENHPELIARAGWILKMNPDAQTPFKLFEILEQASPQKAELMKNLLKEAYRLIEKSGIIENISDYQSKLQSWIKSRNAVRWVQDIIGEIDAGRLGHESLTQARSRCTSPEVRTALAEALTWPLSESTRQTLLTISQGNTPPVESLSSPAINIHALFAEPNDQTCLFLEGVHDFSVLEPFQKRLGEIIQNEKSPMEVRCAVIRCLTRLRHRLLFKEVSEALLHFRVVLVPYLVEYLGVIDPGAVRPYLGRILSIPDVRCKSAAFAFLLRQDFAQALEQLQAYLSHRDRNQVALTISCLSQFDFDLVRETLTEFLKRCDDKRLLLNGLCYYAANPDPEGLFDVYCIEKTHVSVLATEVSNFRQTLTNKLRGKAPESALLEKALHQRWEAASLKQKNRPAYAFPQTTKLRSTFFEGLFQRFAPNLGVFPPTFFWRGTTLVAILGFLYLFWPYSPPAQASRPGGAMISQTIHVTGKVAEVSGKGMIVQDLNGKFYLLYPWKDGFRTPLLHETLRFELVVFRMVKDGLFCGRIRNMSTVIPSHEP